MTVMRLNVEFRSACLIRTRHGATPFAFAVTM